MDGRQRHRFLEKGRKASGSCFGRVSAAAAMQWVFYEFIPEKKVALIGCEAAGKGIDTDKHARTMAKGTPGVSTV